MLKIILSVVGILVLTITFLWLIDWARKQQKRICYDRNSEMSRLLLCNYLSIEADQLPKGFKDFIKTVPRPTGKDIFDWVAKHHKQVKDCLRKNGHL